MSYERVGDLYRDLGQGELARLAYVDSLQIAERLVQAEPQRVDYQRDLSVSYNKLGALLRVIGETEQAKDYDIKDLEIAERLARMEPERADYKRDLVMSLIRVSAGENTVAHRRIILQRALAILEQMQANGQLAPVDETLTEGVRKLLRDCEDEP